MVTEDGTRGARRIAGRTASRRPLRPASIVIFLAFMVLGASFLFPFYYMFVNAFKSTAEYYVNSFNLPRVFDWTNFATMISQFRIQINLLNSLFITLSTIALITVVGVLAAYVFAKRPFPGSKGLFLAIIFTMFMPNQVTLIPLYFQFSRMGLVNTPYSVILCFLAAGIPSCIMLLTAYFKSIPNELCEAATIDGCGFFATIRNVIIPMGKPVIAVNATFVFLRTWNDFLTPLILLTSKETQTVMVALSALVSRYSADPPYQMAGLFIATVPAVVMYLFFQKYLVEGVNAGSLK
ncbi:MAG: carbohydrate ABC transporter permease [Spirochaetota bacterium]